MPSPNPGSARMNFQWKYVDEYYITHDRDGDQEPRVLNIGCADDPLSFGALAYHVDIDDWSHKHRWFKQADAAHLPFPDLSFDLVILGDILEHVEDPTAVTDEACRVTAVGGRLVITVFEEWRLPGHGQFIKEGHEIADELVRTQFGYADRQDHQRHLYPEMKLFDDDKVSHLVHINQFDDQDLIILANNVLFRGFKSLELLKAYEATHEAHEWYNWLMAFERERSST